MSQAKRLRELVAGDELVIAPGAYDGLTARLVELAGFPVVYATGAGISNSQLGVADLGLATMTEVLEQVRRMVSAVGVPVICDIDTGYGNAVNVFRTVREFERAGAAAVQIEDQVMPKKCGHFEGKQVVAFDEAVQKVRAAVDARGSSELVVIARTDALATGGLAEALRRARAFHEAGADALFVEGPRSREELVEIGRSLPGVKVANMVEGGRTPLQTSRDLRAMGFRLAIYANVVLRTSIKAIQSSLEHLRATGDTMDILDRMVTMDERGRVTQKPFYDAIEQKYAVDEGRPVQRSRKVTS
jgi:2-methylisocitrate lyase-like PEP mutase family enzyme